MLLKCVICGDNFEGDVKGMWTCGKCKNKSQHNYSGTSGSSTPTIIYNSQKDIIINPNDKNVAQIKKFINTPIEDINKWLLENNVKEVTSFDEKRLKESRVYAGGGDYREWTETTIIYKIEV